MSYLCNRNRETKIDNNKVPWMSGLVLSLIHISVIINADSKELPVLRILGANSMYDIVKFNTEADKKTIALK